MSPRGMLYLERGLRRPYPATLRRLADARSLTAQEREALTLAIQQGGAAASAAGPSHNLPAALSRFVGRAHAQARVHDLRMTKSMMRLVGDGGVQRV